MTLNSNVVSIDDGFDIEEPKKSGKKGLLTVFMLVVLLVIGFVIIKNPFGQSAKFGDTVVVTYVVSYDNGEVYEYRGNDNPLSFILGQGQVVPGLEDAVFGMSVTKIKNFVVHPEDGFGKYYDPAQKQTLPMVLFDQLGEAPVLGAYYDLGNIKGIIVAIEGEGNKKKIILDTNPLHTWQDLNYELTLIEIL